MHAKFLKKLSVNSRSSDPQPALFSDQKQPASVTDMLNYPDIRPCDFDKTFDAWLVRLKSWGDFTITYRYPLFNINKQITEREFIRQMEKTDTQQFGPFNSENICPVKCVLFREYLDQDNKKAREEYIFELVRLNLRPGVKDVWIKKH